MGHHHYDDDLEDKLDMAVDAGLIRKDTAAYGSAMKCIHQGYDSLSERQKHAYDHYAAPHLAIMGQEREVHRRILGMPE